MTFWCSHTSLARHLALILNAVQMDCGGSEHGSSRAAQCCQWDLAMQEFLGRHRILMTFRGEGNGESIDERSEDHSRVDGSSRFTNDSRPMPIGSRRCHSRTGGSCTSCNHYQLVTCGGEAPSTRQSTLWRARGVRFDPEEFSTDRYRSGIQFSSTPQEYVLGIHQQKKILHLTMSGVWEAWEVPETNSQSSCIDNIDWLPDISLPFKCIRTLLDESTHLSEVRWYCINLRFKWLSVLAWRFANATTGRLWLLDIFQNLLASGK
jgi:hypothetical protein